MSVCFHETGQSYSSAKTPSVAAVQEMLKRCTSTGKESITGHSITTGLGLASYGFPARGEVRS